MNIDKRRERLILINGEPAKSGSDFLHYIDKPLMVLNPNYTALLLNIAEGNNKKAISLFNDKITSKKIDKGEYYELDFEGGDTLFFDFMEYVFIALVFSYSAVECIVNSLIPNYVIMIGKKDNMQEFKSKNFLEKNVKLDIKIKKILPKIYKYGFNASKIKCWENFKKLELYRNEIMHLKSLELSKEGKSSQTKIIGQMLVDCIKLEIVSSARELIKYLYSKISDAPPFPNEISNINIELKHYMKHYQEKKINVSGNIELQFGSLEDLNKFIDDSSLEIDGNIKVVIK